MNGSKKPNINMILILFCIAMSLTTIMTALSSGTRQTYHTISYSDFIKEVDAGHIESVQVSDTQITAITDTGAGYVTDRMEDESLTDRLLEADVDIERLSTVDGARMISSLVSLAFYGFFFYYIFKMVSSRSNGKTYEVENATITFADVAGQEEAKESLKEIVDFLHDSKKYADAGAKLPKGALLVGPPGTGKTLLAKAVAGEAKVPFYSLSGSDFVEMFVGLGASRVRSLFKEAKKKAPCIIFIDEIDAIAKRRGMGSNSEYEQTLNQLLTEMDGFGTDTGIVVLGATNRPEGLDPAILRPGRFDRRIEVELPDVNEREAILKVHTKDVKLADDVDLKALALQTVGVSGAELANMVNEAAIAAVKDSREAITQNDLIASIETVLVGREKVDRVLNEKEKKIVAFHEIGHAFTAVKVAGSKPVQKISIIPRTKGALGYVMQAPAEETYLKSKEEMMNEITVLLAGRAAEDIVFGSVTTGASNDLEKATDLAKDMVMRFGFGKHLTCIVKQEDVYLGGRRSYDCSPQMQAETDKEVSVILDGCYHKAKQTVSENLPEIKRLAEYLFENESITGEKFMELIKKNNGGDLCENCAGQKI